MIWQSVVTEWNHILERGQRQWQILDHRTDGWLAIFIGSTREVLSYEASLIGAAFAYFTLLSVFPLILLTLAIASFFVEPTQIGTGILERLEFVIPGFEQLLGTNLERILTSRGAITRLSAITLIWSASSLFYVITRALDSVWVGERVRVRSVYYYRALAIVLTLLLAVLLWTASIAWSFAVPIADRLMTGQLVILTPLFSFGGAALLNIFVFTMLYIALPHVSLTWRDVIIGAVIAGLFWELAKRAFLFFVTNYLTLSNLIYGSVTAIIALLAWAYLSGLIFLFGAHLNVRYKRKRQEHPPEAARMGRQLR
jgi:membrane protein